MLCEACLSNDNYRFAYGCSGPCDNVGSDELLEAVDQILKRPSARQVPKDGAR